MTDFEDRLIDISLSEELGENGPPDSIDDILHLAAETTNASGTINAPPTTASSVGRTNYVAPVKRPVFKSNSTLRLVVACCSVAAGLLFAISVRTFLSNPFVDPVVDAPDGLNINTPAITAAQLVTQDGFRMPASTRSSSLMGRTVLQDGWIYADKDSKSLMVGVSLLEFQNARAVVRIGRAPDLFQAAEITRQLELSKLIHSQEETNMLMNPRRWISGLGMAICVLAGQATMNNQSLQADESGQKITLQSVFAKFDTNRNGTIDMSECVCKCCKKCDLDQNGKITRGEFDKAVQQLTGSRENFIRLVEEHGGVDKFYTAAKSGLLDNVAAVSMDSVFAHLDKNNSGVLEKSECVCPGSKCADANADGKVTRKELVQVAVQFFGSEEKFLNEVRSQGGVESFLANLSKQKSEKAGNPTSFRAVFAMYDRNGSGVLEKSECICQGSKMADLNKDGKVTQEELGKVAVKMFGSMKKFNKYIDECGGIEKFYAAVSRESKQGK